MDEYRIVHLIESEGYKEYVIILEKYEDIDEYIPHGFEVESIQEVDGDFTSYPCNRLLQAKG